MNSKVSCLAVIFIAKLPILNIDASDIFVHFTTNDAESALGSHILS